MPNFIAKPPFAALGEGMLHVPHVPGERHDRQSATPCQAECALLGKLALTTDDKVYCVYVASDEHAVRAPCPERRIPGGCHCPRTLGDRPNDGRSRYRLTTP